MNSRSGAILAGWVLSAATVLPAQPPTSPISEAMDSATALRPVERDFLVNATNEGRLVAEVSRLAISQAEASGVRDFAQQLVGDYGQINGALEALARRKGVALPLAPTSFSEPYRELAHEAGSGFDRAFVRECAATSRRQLRWCERAIEEAKDADVRDLAGTLLPMLRDHVNKSIELSKTL